MKTPATMFWRKQKLFILPVVSKSDTCRKYDCIFEQNEMQSQKWLAALRTFSNIEMNFHLNENNATPLLFVLCDHFHANTWIIAIFVRIFTFWMGLYNLFIVRIWNENGINEHANIDINLETKFKLSIELFLKPMLILRINWFSYYTIFGAYLEIHDKTTIHYVWYIVDDADCTMCNWLTHIWANILQRAKRRSTYLPTLSRQAQVLQQF